MKAPIRSLIKTAFIFICVFFLGAISYAQKVGIGTTQFTPSSTLDVKGNLTIGGTYGGTNAAPANGALIEGNVGIGSISPSQKLDVTGSINASTSYIFAGTPVIYNNANDVYANLRVIQNNSTTLTDGMYLNYNSGGTTSGHLRFYANGTNLRGYFDAGTGHFAAGLGTGAWARITAYEPTTLRQIAANVWLDMSSDGSGYGLVGGNIYTGQGDNSFRYANTHGSIGGIGLATNYPSWNQASIISSGTTSSTAGSTFTPVSIATFTYNGNVGINQTNPGYRLTVTGGGIGGNYGILPNYAGWGAYGTGDGGAAIYNDNGSYQKLMVVGNNSAGGVRKVGVWDFLQVNGQLQVIDGTQGAGKVLTSDASGIASWQTASSGGGIGNTTITVYTASGTFTVPAGVTKVMVEVFSGGGGAAAGCNSCLPGSYPEGGTGGGGGGYCRAMVTVTPGASMAVTVGAGGNGGFGDGANGSAGGTSSFGGLVVVQGGAAGVHNSSGAAGGWTSTCSCLSSVMLSGQQSQTSSQLSTQVCEGGPGGGVPMGGSGGVGGAAQPFAFLSGRQGTNGVQPGGGGGGGGMYIGGSSGAGGYGAAGAVIIYY